MSKNIIKYSVGCERKNYMYLFVMLLLMPLFGVIPTSWADELYNPKPYDRDFILPMPNGAEMIFRPVFLGIGDKPFAFKEREMGGKSSAREFYEYPTKVRFGGSFIKKMDWMFYIGKYEVTKDQYYSIMDKSKMTKMTDNQKPITNISWFEAQEFINKYNLWLYEKADDPDIFKKPEFNSLPENKGIPGYLRLATEVEWEFAARGGVEGLEEGYPYPDEELRKYENFGSSTKNIVKADNIGTYLPNLIKVHDMLGNVKEMTSSLYSIEYYIGRSGGFVARGGYAGDKQGRIRPTLRSEMPFYKDSEPMKGIFMGIRLVIASQIIINYQTHNNLEKAWPAYFKEYRVAPDTLIFSTQSVTAQTNYQLKDAIDAIGYLKTELEKNSGNQTIDNWLTELKRVDASFVNIRNTVRDSEREKASTYIKMAVDSVYLVCRGYYLQINDEQKALAHIKEFRNKNPGGLEKSWNNLKSAIKKHEQTVRDVLNEFYVNQLEELVKIDDEFVDDAFKEYMRGLGNRAGTEKQQKVAARVKKHYDDKVFEEEELYQDFKDLSGSL